MEAEDALTAETARSSTPTRSRERAGHAVTRGDVLLALTTLPVQDPAAYARAMAATIAQALDVDRVDVLRLDAAHATLVSLGASETHTAEVQEHLALERLPLAEAPSLASVLQTGVPYRTRDVRDDAALPAAFARADLHALLAVPLVTAGQCVGIVYLASRRVAAFDAEDQALLTVVATRVGLLMEHAALARERAQEQARREFLGIVSHELKTPVAVIKAYTEALRHRAARDGDVEGGRILERVEDQATRMLGLIDDLLDLQRLESDLLPLEKGRVDLPALVAHVVDGMQAMTTTQHLVVSASEAIVVQADRQRIEQVLVNLIENAMKYSPEGGDITVTVQRATRPDVLSGLEEQALVAVGDQGIGIAPEDLPRIFERFYQAEGGRLYRGVRGLGVGLYIARAVVERHGGRLWAESAPGTGSTFYFTLPCAESEPSGLTNSPSHTP